MEDRFKRISTNDVITSINIICTKNQNDVFAFYAEFFELCGFFVIKSIDMPYYEDTGFKPGCTLDIRQEKYIWTKSEEKTIKAEVLMECLINAINEVKLANDYDLEKLANVYVKNNLMRVKILNRFFYKDDMYAKKCKKYLQNAIEYIETIILSNKNKKDFKFYSQFFYVSCKLMINKFEHRLYEKEDYLTVILMDEALSLAEQGKVPQIDLLVADIAKREAKYQGMECDYLIRAYKQSKSQLQRKNIEYKIGKNFELVQKNDIVALKCYYRKFDTKTSNDYMIKYDIAKLYLKKGEIECAEKYFESVIVCFKDEIDTLEPQEIMYLYEGYNNFLKILRLKMGEVYAYEYLKKLENTIKDTIKNSTYIENVLRTIQEYDQNFDEMVAEEKNQIEEYIFQGK